MQRRPRATRQPCWQGHDELSVPPAACYQASESFEGIEGRGGEWNVKLCTVTKLTTTFECDGPYQGRVVRGPKKKEKAHVRHAMIVDQAKSFLPQREQGADLIPCNSRRLLRARAGGGTGVHTRKMEASISGRSAPAGYELSQVLRIPA
ncbi:hypothetical protein CSOJ01_03996 [Colletotrichum sojae]|uniref:Uncharacterized protein n=1 Tax=Colletotrichum sojae TaxID=2175907 RepID=A0A8H6MZB2_9PEZI|nr:hypothetical protein CSOJ01_03996 [Colletotrichum sojae]